MYLKGSNRRVSTFTRPQAERQSEPAAEASHRLESILANPALRPVLRWMTSSKGSGKCFFQRLCESYDNPSLTGWERHKWALPTWAINRLIRKARADRELLKLKLFHHPPTVKALALTARSIGRYGLMQPQRFTAPLLVVWNITKACNLSCKHCYQDARHRPADDELSTEEKLRVVDDLGDELVPFLAIAGGEPLMARDLFAVLRRCEERGIHATLATNGTLLTPQKCRELKAAGVKYVEISLDSLDEHEHDQFRQQQGAWRRAVEGIRNSVAAGIRTGMACCLTRANVQTAERMIEFAIELGCSTFSHFNFIPAGRGRQYFEFDLLPEQREALLLVLHRYLQEGRISIISTAPQFGRSCIMNTAADGVFSTGHAGQGRGTKALVLARYLGGCGAGRCYCCIQPDGSVTPCVYISSPVVGNLRQQRLREMWDNQLFRVLQDREDRGDHCGVCDYRVYCGGCRARALAYTSDIQAGDPGCRYNAGCVQQVTPLVQLYSS
ncbi:MAG: radical SAM protein [Terriglobales bacterium]